MGIDEQDPTASWITESAKEKASATCKERSRFAKKVRWGGGRRWEGREVMEKLLQAQAAGASAQCPRDSSLSLSQKKDAKRY